MYIRTYLILILKFRNTRIWLAKIRCFIYFVTLFLPKEYRKQIVFQVIVFYYPRRSWATQISSAQAKLWCAQWFSNHPYRTWLWSDESRTSLSNLLGSRIRGNPTERKEGCHFTCIVVGLFIKKYLLQLKTNFQLKKEYPKKFSSRTNTQKNSAQKQIPNNF